MFLEPIMKKPPEQIPFNPAKWPFFYGWVILFWGIIGILLSVPGQTTGVSAFIEPLIKDLGISRMNISIAYGIGTFSSSFLITPAGKLFDRIGARWMGPFSCLFLGFVLLLFSQADFLSAGLQKVAPSWLALTGLLAFLFFLLRLSGQGILTMASREYGDEVVRSSPGLGKRDQRSRHCLWIFLHTDPVQRDGCGKRLVKHMVFAGHPADSDFHAFTVHLFPRHPRNIRTPSRRAVRPFQGSEKSEPRKHNSH